MLILSALNIDYKDYIDYIDDTKKNFISWTLK